jgi:hypothetical protein
MQQPLQQQRQDTSNSNKSETMKETNEREDFVVVSTAVISSRRAAPLFLNVLKYVEK